MRAGRGVSARRLGDEPTIRRRAAAGRTWRGSTDSRGAELEATTARPEGQDADEVAEVASGSRPCNRAEALSDSRWPTELACRSLSTQPLSCAAAFDVTFSRVAPGDCSPGAPTDPDVRNSRIRLLGSRFRCTIDRADTSGPRERKAIQQLRHADPVPPRALRATLEPLAPRLNDLPVEPFKGRVVAYDPVVPVVPS